jgi:hypothetical protein
MTPRMRRVGSAQPAWKIQIVWRNSFPRVRAVVASPLAGVSDAAGADGSGCVAMILTQCYHENKEKFHCENGVRKREYVI